VVDAHPSTARRDPIAELGLRVEPMEPGLAAALVRFHESLSPATTRSRFFMAHPHLMVTEVTRFTEVDHDDREALVVLDGDRELVAVARFDRLAPGSAVAEVAFVVADSWQHRGIGAAVFAALVGRARELGVTRFVADTLAGNRAMRTVFRHAGYPVTEVVADGVVRVTIELAVMEGSTP